MIALCVAALAAATIAARFTDSLDALEADIVRRQAIVSPTPSKKEAKIYKSVLKKLGKSTSSLKKEIVTAKKVVGPLSKLKDPAVDGLVVAAVDGIREDVFDAIDAAENALSVALGKVSEASVRKQINAARDLMERDFGETSVKKRLGLLKKAEARARKANSLAGKLTSGGGGGGGGGACDGQDVGAGDTANVTKSGSSFGVDKVQFKTTNDAAGSRVTISFNDCDGKRTVSITLPSPLTTGSYFGGSIFPASSTSFFAGPLSGFGQVSFAGSVTVTGATGRLQMTFDFNLNADTYAGTIDIPIQ